MERDPATNPPPASPDPEDAKPTGDAPSEAPAPFKGVDEDIKPVEERLEDVERERT